MTETLRAQFRAAIVAIAPAVLLAGFIYHPFLARLTDSEALAAAVSADTTRWGLSHLIVGAGTGLTALAFLAIRSYLRDAGEERWSAPALPFVIMGGTLFAMLPGMEFAPLTAAKTGAEIDATQTALQPWFFPTLFTAATIFALGVFGFALAIAHSRALSPQLTWLVVGALGVMGFARFVPLGVVQFYVGGVAGVVALWPLAYEMWKHPEARLVEQPRTVPAV